MKNVFRIMLLAAAASLFALPAYAQDAAAAQTPASAQDAEAKAKLYQQFLDLIKGGPEQQRQASVIGKEYISKYPTPTDDADKQILDYIKNWVAKYDVAVREFELNKALTEKNYARAFEIGRQMLGENPENVGLALTLARVGLGNATAGASANKGLNPEALRFTRTAIQLVESGKAPAKWDPFTSREDALGWLYYTQGILALETSPDEAIALLLKAAQSNSTVKKEPATFFHLGNAYVNGEYKKAVAAYKAAFPEEGGAIPEERKAEYDRLIAQVNGSLDRIIDAYARAIALSTKPEQAKFKTDLTAQVATYHKARHENSTPADVQTLISNVLSRPLPQPGQPAAPETPAAASTTPAATPTPTPQPSTPNGAKPAATPTPTSTTPTKPRQ